jgi:plasmid maintenance system antidote protein VapI
MTTDGNRRDAMIYQAREEFAALLEAAGIRQSELARRIKSTRSSVSHMAARRRNIGGAFAARIAAAYSEAAQVTQEEALQRLFVLVAEKKYQVADRKRGARGRFMKAEQEPNALSPSDEEV